MLGIGLVQGCVAAVVAAAQNEKRRWVARAAGSGPPLGAPLHWQLPSSAGRGVAHSRQQCPPSCPCQTGSTA
jgi:hypothetical protein